MMASEIRELSAAELESKLKDLKALQKDHQAYGEAEGA